MTVYTRLEGSTHDPLPNSRPAGPINKSERASLTITVRSVGDLDALEKKVYEDSALPLAERNYLSREEIVQQYGASEDDLNLVEQHAQEHDLMVAYRSAAERSIVLSGTLGDLLDAFPAELQLYHSASGPYRARRRNKHPEPLGRHHHRRVRIRHPTQLQVAESAQGSCRIRTRRLEWLSVN